MQKDRAAVISNEGILKAAEINVRSGGYGQFSLSGLAAQMSIDISQIESFFATKEDLCAALAHQYTHHFLQALGDPAELKRNHQNPIEHYVSLFRHALNNDKKMCLCGLLGAETELLPEQVRAETKRFFTSNIDWLKQAYTVNGQKNAESAAFNTLSLLEGAIMVSRAIDDTAYFEQATNWLR